MEIILIWAFLFGVTYTTFKPAPVVREVPNTEKGK